MGARPRFARVTLSSHQPSLPVIPADPKSILILKPSSLGDVLQAIPVLRLLRRRFPSAHIAWWVDASLVPLLKGDPDLSEVIPFQRRTLRTWKGFWEFARSVLRMRRARFDWVIDLQGLARSSMVSWVVNGELTIGVDDPREGAAALYDLYVPRPSASTHAVEWYLSVLTRLGVPIHEPFDWLPKVQAISTDLESRWPVNGHRWIALQPGARWWNKRWPVEHFQDLIRQLGRADASLRFVILGGGEDVDLGARLSEALPDRCLDLTGRLTLAETIEWLRRCSVMVTNDTGPMHAGAALGTPIIGLFGPTDPRRTGPYGQESTAVRLGLSCSPCLKQRCRHPQVMECLRGITPATVAGKVRESLHI